MRMYSQRGDIHTEKSFMSVWSQEKAIKPYIMQVAVISPHLFLSLYLEISF